CVGNLFVTVRGFGLLLRILTAENIPPHHQVYAPPAKSQPDLVATYVNLPRSLEATQDQTAAGVAIYAFGSISDLRKDREQARGPATSGAAFQGATAILTRPLRST